MQKNNAVETFRSKNQTSEKASPETAAAALRAIRADIDGDAMADVWDNKLNATQKHGLWLVAGLPGVEDGEYHKRWCRFPASYCAKLNSVLSTFAGLATRIKGAI